MKYRKPNKYRFKKETLDDILDRIKVRDEYNKRHPLSFFEEKRKETINFLNDINKKGYINIVDIFRMYDIHSNLFRNKRYSTTGEQEIVIMWNELKLFNNQYDRLENYIKQKD
jgi:hypothetical protein